MRAVGLALAIMVGGCGNAVGGGASDGFAPGTWQIDAWLESEQGSTRDAPGSHQSMTVKVSDADAALPPATLFATRFYHGLNNADLKFEGGRIHGSYDQPRVDDIAGQTVPISGTYARDRFDVRFDYRVFGMTVSQAVEGRLIQPAG